MFRILTQDDRQKIHQTGKRILEQVGVRLHSKRVYDMMIEAGAVPDAEDAIKVYFPQNMVEKYLTMCPKQFEITDRSGSRQVIGKNSAPLYFTSNATLYLRGTSQKANAIRENDLIDFIRVANKLENIYGLVGTSIEEYKPECRDYVGFKLMSCYSFKHLRPCIYTPAGAEAIIEMADVILEGKPLRENMFFSLGYSIVSPLTWSETGLELFYRSKGYGIPIMINSEPMAGGTSPVTLAGSLAMADAEVISGIIINQVMEPGRPCIYNIGFAHVMDMMNATVLTGAPENALLQAAGAEMAEYHNIPCASWALSDSTMLDSQASYEKLLTLLSHTLSNVNFVWGIGNIEASKTISPEIAVIDNELIGNCTRFSRGISVDEVHLAFDVIKNVCFKESFLETEHTMEFYREEIRCSKLPNRIDRVNWERKGSKSIEEKAGDIVKDILNKKPEIYLTGRQMERIEQIERKWRSI